MQQGIGQKRLVVPSQLYLKVGASIKKSESYKKEKIRVDHVRLQSVRTKSNMPRK